MAQSAKQGEGNTSAGKLERNGETGKIPPSNDLKTMHLLYAGVFYSSPNAVLALKSVRSAANAIIDFNITAVNPKAKELFDRPESKLADRTLWNEYPELMDQGVFQELANVVETGEPLDRELMQEIGRKQVWLHVVAVKVDDGLVLTLQDITERKANEQALQQQKTELELNSNTFKRLLEAVPHITWTNKPNGENNTFNEHWYEYTGLAREDSDGWGWQAAFHPDDLKIINKDYKRCLRTGEVHNAQARILRKSDNTYRWHLIKVVPVRNEAGEITIWIGTATDIQDQKEAEEATIKLRLSQQRDTLNAILQAQEEERSRISEALHNGLGQVLYATKLNLDSLQPGNTQQKKVKDTVDHFLKEGIKITRNISFELTPTVLKEFGIKTAVEEIVAKFKCPRLHITSKIKGTEDNLSYAAALSVYRIIQELLNNIVKHSGATNAEVELTLGRKKVMLLVRDNGKGITEKELHRKDGVGLKSIRNRVNLLEGKLDIKSTAGKGCSIEINFNRAHLAKID